MTKRKKSTAVCPACNGRGVVAVATDDVKCTACNGTGKVSG